MPQVHHFETTGEAYDACQCDENIKNGDVLVIESEKVVGIADTWPFAITEAHGDLHQLTDGVSPETACEGKWAASVPLARRIAARLNCSVCGGKGYVETKVWADARYYSTQPAATRVVCWKCHNFTPE